MFWVYRLSIFLETVDPAKKKHPINNLDGLTLSYKVRMERNGRFYGSIIVIGSNILTRVICSYYI